MWRNVKTQDEEASPGWRQCGDEEEVPDNESLLDGCLVYSWTARDFVQNSISINVHNRFNWIFAQPGRILLLEPASEFLGDSGAALPLLFTGANSAEANDPLEEMILADPWANARDDGGGLSSLPVTKPTMLTWYYSVIKSQSCKDQWLAHQKVADVANEALSVN